MPENNQMMSVEGQLVGMPLAGPESFSQQQLDYLKRALGVDETVLWTGAVHTASSQLNMSEDVGNFERLRFFIKEDNTAIATHVAETVADAQYVYIGCLRTNGNNAGVELMTTLIKSNEGKTLTIDRNIIRTNGTAGTSSADIIKIVGIHRIAGGN